VLIFDRFLFVFSVAVVFSLSQILFASGGNGELLGNIKAHGSGELSI
jgi:hypothetical protein